MYVVQLSDGREKEMTANVIAEKILEHCNDDGHTYSVLDSIIGHRCTQEALTKEQGWSVGKSNKTRKPTTAGWELLVVWKDGSNRWIPLSELKNSCPIEVAEYARSQNIDDEAAFAWWVPHTLRKKEAIMAKVKSRYWRTSEKFGLKLPHSVEEALKIDTENRNSHWRDAIKKELLNVKIAFEIYRDRDITPKMVREDSKLLPGYQEIKYHFVFDIKMDFTRKARLVAGGHTTETPSSITYSSVVSRDSMRIAFTMAQMLELDILSADIGNAYLNAPCREKIWVEAGPEFGESWKGCILLIKRALYGLKSSGAIWRNLLSSSMWALGFTSCIADPDVWLRPQIKPDGQEYYEYVLIYVDDIMCMSHKAKDIMLDISKLYKLKEPPAEPKTYLGANFSKQVVNGRSVWCMTCDEYVRESIQKVRMMLYNDGNGYNLTTKTHGLPWKSGYKPEIDITPLLQDEMVSRYQNLLGMLRWIVELGRIDILQEVSKLSSYNAAPREGHLLALYRIYSYLNRFPKSKLFYDVGYMDLESIFEDKDWSDFYPDAEEPIPDRAPSPRGPSVQTICFCDADHATNLATRRSHTGIVIYLMGVPIIWYSKRQNTIESSTFGSEFNALRIATDQIQAFRYKLRMMGIRVDEPTYVYVDNRSVSQCNIPEGQLQKKHNQVCYHRVRECIAMGMIRLGWIDRKFNVADLFTKHLDYNTRFRHIHRMIRVENMHINERCLDVMDMKEEEW